MKPKEINQLILELFGGKIDKEYTEEDIHRIISQKNVFPFCHYKDDKLVAMVMLYIVELFSRKLGVIEEVVTLNEYRKQGIGSGLVNLAVDKAKLLGCDCVELTVHQDNPRVKRFYEGLGFSDRHNNSMRLWLRNNTNAKI